MKITLIEQKEAPLLMRKRIHFEVDNEKQKTPSEPEIKKAVAENLKVNEETVAIRHVYQKFGIAKAKVIAHVYKNPEDLKRIEHIKKKQKKKKEGTEEKK
jgi:small subunit ribosomal protein S24e